VPFRAEDLTLPVVANRRAPVIGWIALAVIVAMLAACGAATAPSASAPTVSSAWARPAPADGQSAAYFDIDGASAMDTLLAVTSPAAGMVEIHETMTDDAGMTGMHPIERLEVPAGATIRFEPGGYHLMLMDLAGELVVGQTIELDFQFELGGQVTVTAEIRQA
jgi:periplasmic copper chaperone A